MKILPKDDGKSVDEKMAELEKECDEMVEIVNGKDKEFDDELSVDYCFCVVFETTAERNDWIKKHNLEGKMQEGNFFLAKDFIK
ncbi:MAG: hypothetical protein NC548_49980 [Lachnospiraceae bacterium]|nr:hypothetical protein [Lachnospiraceae bacterium]